MIPLHLPHRVTVRRMVRAGADPYGNDEVTAVEVNVAAHVQTRGNTAKPSQSLRRAPVTMHVPADVTVFDGDEITWAGRKLRVLGDVTHQLDLFTGAPAYGEVELEAVS
ncbi:hypothetical protein AGRA3207_000174 [Actinomadura graeca]|uniref:Head-to-tail stopper n=1 Tax=Actinomadura graeca TaxID=2750812 RepID=A0ABX8QPD4_9ACTN|nr:hypothetical protein [Actinomadura graeca]QXJ19612.1 hypothetical protein AGRA3207_000174 [Actinomadura graeca]